MSHTVNPELLLLANRRLMEKSAVVPPQPPADPSQGGGGDPSMQVGMPPMTPGALGVQQPVDPSQAAAAAGGGAAPPGMMDPSMMGALPPAQPQPAAAAGPNAAQKLKPEQMMQMIDYRMYNMQQQLTAIMNALGVQLPPEAIVLPPGSTSAPPAESALPGAPGAPTPSPAPAGGQGGGAGGELPTDVYAGQDPAQTGGAVQPIPPVKAANWWETSTVREKLPATPSLQETAGAALALYRSRVSNAG